MASGLAERAVAEHSLAAAAGLARKFVDRNRAADTASGLAAQMVAGHSRFAGPAAAVNAAGFAPDRKATADTVLDRFDLVALEPRSAAQIADHHLGDWVRLGADLAAVMSRHGST
ncbi:hypothetical protein V5R04_08505 [Jonesiaceae bacterium BS-20]|uniref:Uncharacterized protein n=1 Tax=Jonesiaceae bacterium BS-20 TaxID=3120821 RepID=A0AAU7DTH3_9MICO